MLSMFPNCGLPLQLLTEDLFLILSRHDPWFQAVACPGKPLADDFLLVPRNYAVNVSRSPPRMSLLFSLPPHSHAISTRCAHFTALC
jgi:hypothetical protein